MSSAADPTVAAAFGAIESELGELGATDVDPVDIVDAYAYSRRLEAIGRRVRALQVQFLDTVARTGIHAADGHMSPKVMTRFANNLSPAEALRRDKASTTLRGMPVVAAGFAEGSIGSCQVDRIARVHGNRRVRDQLEAQDANVAILAARLTYEEFPDRMTDWER